MWGDLRRPRATQCSVSQRHPGGAVVRSLAPSARYSRLLISACVAAYLSLWHIRYRRPFLQPCGVSAAARPTVTKAFTATRAHRASCVPCVRQAEFTFFLHGMCRARRQTTRLLYSTVWFSGMLVAPGARGSGLSVRNSPALMAARQHELAWVWGWGRSGRGG